MRQAVPVLAILAASACIPAAALRATPAFPAALMTGILCAGTGIILYRYRPSEVALFLLAQPCIFLSWDISPYVPLLLEGALITGFLFSLGLLRDRMMLASTAVFLAGLAAITALLARCTHVILPLILFLVAALLAYFAILGLEYRIASRAGGGLP